MFRRPALLTVSTLLFVVAGCGWDDRPSGVAAVDSDRSGIADVVVVTVPPAGDAAPTVRRLPSPADQVETLVEPSTPRPDTVAVIGDSLTLSAEDEILSALMADGLDVVTVDGAESRRMTRGSTALPPGTAAIENVQRLAEPGLWVIALGTNDVASVESLDGFRTEMRELLELLPSDVPIVWVDLWIRDRHESITQANRLIRAELRQWSGGAAVVDWYSHGEDDGIITSDGVHLTTEGQQLFADSIAAAVDELFAP